MRSLSESLESLEGAEAMRLNPGLGRPESVAARGTLKSYTLICECGRMQSCLIFSWFGY
jgi:hypothetical protein